MNDLHARCPSLPPDAAWQSLGDGPRDCAARRCFDGSRARRGVHGRSGLREAAGRRAARVAHQLSAGRRHRQHPLVGTVQRSGADEPRRVRAAREPRPRDRRRARRRVSRPAGDDAQPALSAGQLQPQREPQPLDGGRHFAVAARRPIRTPRCTRARSAPRGRSISSAACGARPRPRRRASTRPSRAAAASCCRSSPAWRRATSCLRALDRQLEISQQTAQNYANTIRIFELRHKGGVVSKLELEQVQSQYQQALAAIPSLEQRIAAQENLIAVLQGRNPYPIPRGKSIDELALPGIPADLPSSLLERRPDILQAEQDLVAANADIGAARALYYPQLSLTGSLRLDQRGVHQFPHRARRSHGRSPPASRARCSPRARSRARSPAPRPTDAPRSRSISRRSSTPFAKPTMR